MRTLSAATALLLCGCGEAVWVPTVAIPWWEVEDTVPAERVADDCEVVIAELLLGIPSGSVLDSDRLVAGVLPGNQALQLVGASPTTLGEVRIPVDTPTGFQVQLGPPGRAAEGARAGNATEAQRRRLAAVGGLVTASIACGDDAVTVELPIAPVTVQCGIPELEVASRNSFSTVLELDPAALLGDDPDALLGQPWIDADADADGVLSLEERGALVSDAALVDRVAARSDDGRCALVP